MMIDLHSNRTPNSYKPTIMLEEVGLPYRVIHYDVMKGEHFTPEYRAINPNNKLPAITDHEPVDGGGPFSVFETGAILIYLAEKTGQLLSTDFRKRSTTLQWLVWQVAGLGPMHGQAHHFVRYAPESERYGVERYTKEALCYGIPPTPRRVPCRGLFYCGHRLLAVRLRRRQNRHFSRRLSVGRSLVHSDHGASGSRTHDIESRDCHAGRIRGEAYEAHCGTMV
jgi:hypothetical protein